MNELTDNIAKTRQIKGTSINVYVSNIRKVYRELFNTDFDKLSRLHKYKKVSKYLDDLVDTTSKNILTAIIVALKSDPNTPVKVLEKYNKLLEQKTKKFFKDYNLHQMTEKDSQNWVTKTEVDQIKKKLKNNIPDIKHTTPQRKDLEAFQQYLILLLYTELPPLRNNFSNTIITDDPDIALRSIENAVDLKNKQFVLKNYKTDNVYGTKIIKLPNTIIKLIKKWIKINKTGYLLINTTNQTPMTSNGITKYLNKIFNPKKVSTTILRKLYLSNKYSVKEMENDAYIMGHSVNTQQLVYRKK